MPILRFLGSGPGRIARLVAGLVLIAIGVGQNGAWRALGVVGLVPLAAGAFDVCLLGPLFRLPFGGRAFRARCAQE